MPNFQPIDDPADARIADYRDIRERDLVGRQNRFIAEGEVVLRTLLESRRHRPLSLLIDAKRAEKLGPLLGRLGGDVPIYLAARGVLDAIAGFPLHRGVLALGEREVEPSVDELLAATGEAAFVVVLMGIANHDNMGGIFRNAAAFGADAILLDPHCCDPLYRKAIRVSVGTALTVPHARFGEGEDIVGALVRHGLTVLSLTPSGGTALRELVPPARAAILLGTEGPGLPASVLERTRTIRIAMANGVDSLNVATTSGIVLHALSRA